MDTSISTAVSHPVIAGHEITTDVHGRFNLNAIHRASDAGKGKEPSYWTATKQAQELIDEVKSQTKNSWFEPLEAIRGGAQRGTYAHELLAISYAGWISPKFQLQVNQVFLDYRMGKRQAAGQQKALPNPLTPAHQRTLQRAIARRAQALPQNQRRSAFSRIYKHLKDRFEVATYKDVPDELFTEALGAVESVSLEGVFMPKNEALAVLDEGGLYLGPDEVCNLLALCTHAKWLQHRWQFELGPALRALDSRHANECHEHVLAAGRIASCMQRKAGLLPPAA